MAAKGLFINSTEQGFTVRGINNNFFPDNATLAYPANSVILITDESDMATFRSASNYDVLFSALIKDININGEQVTKDSIIETFNEAANKPMSNPDSFTSVEYDGKNDLIFYNDKGEEVAKVDVTPFIKDGMIEDVEISEGNLVIHFNTDSEIKDIYIPLTEIFDPNQYYTKTEIDAKEGVINSALTEVRQDVDKKANAAEVYSKTESDAKYATQVVVNEEIASRIEAIRDVNTALEGKADKSDTYAKTEVDTALSAKVDQSDFDVKEEVISTALVELDTTKQDKLTAGANITIENNVISSTGGGGTQVQADWNQTDDTAVDYIKNKPTIPDTSEFVTKEEYNPKEVAIAKALTQLNDTKADKTELPDVSTFATKTELNEKQDTLVSGTNIKTVNNQSILGEGNIEIQGGGGGTQQQADWTESDTTDPSYIQHKPTLATVATSGSYNDLSNKPTIPTNTSDLSNDSNFVEGVNIFTIETISQSDYDALVSPDTYTLYIITSNV